MAHSFITNKDRLLSDIITGILPKSDAVDILVGYFYFSGYAHLADKLADKYLRILVGLDIDTRISNRVREVEELVEWQRIRSKVREEYFNNLVRLINETDNTDTDETIKIFRQFQRKIFIPCFTGQRKSAFYHIAHCTALFNLYSPKSVVKSSSISQVNSVSSKRHRCASSGPQLLDPMPDCL